MISRRRFLENACAAAAAFGLPARDLGVRCVLLKGDYEGRACE